MEKGKQVSIPTLLVSFFFFFFFLLAFCGGRASAERSDIAVLGRKLGGTTNSYAVIFDAGSSGSRVHVYCFDGNLDLLPIGDELELFVKTKPGLSSYSSNPEEGANSLLPLLQKAESVVPENLRGKTPVRVGATAGLRSLGTETSEKILLAVRNLLQKNTSLNYKAEWVSILDGTQEGSYMWATINYLLRNMGQSYPQTVGVVDLGGGSVQMAYAISERNAANAPAATSGTYVNELSFKGTKYYLYVHSYLNYGLLASRAEILKNDDGSGHFCILKGFNGTYKYGDSTYDASAPRSGSSYTKCRKAIVEALKVDAPCKHQKCTFGGVWNGGGGDGQEHLYLASFFYDKAVQTGFVNSSATIAQAMPSDFEEAAKTACKVSYEDAKTAYSSVYADDIPYVCMDLVYQYTLLVDGLGLKPQQKVTLVSQVPYGKFHAEAAWPLGSAIEVVTSASSRAYS